MEVNLSEIYDIDKYLEALHAIRDTVMIFFSVRDTVGANFRKKSSELVRLLGIKTDLCGKHGHSYIGMIN